MTSTASIITLQFNQLIAYADAHDDTHSIDRFDLILLLADHIRDDLNNIDDLNADDFLLSYSICPMHRCDYAICFDDNDPECADIRAAHPDYDN